MKENKKNRRFLVLAALFSTGILLMIEGVMTPTINMLYTRYPNATGLLNFAITGSYLAGILGSLLIVPLSKRFSDKAILVVSSTVGALGGIIWLLYLDPLTLSVGRTLTQLAYPIVNVIAVNYINHLYDDVEVRGRVQGVFNAFKNLTTAALSAAAGVLAVQSIQRAYSLNLLPLISIVLLIIFLPSGSENVPTSEEKQNKASIESKGYGMTFWLMAGGYFLTTMGFCSIMYYGSMYVEENGIGTSATTGSIMSAASIAGMLVSLVFGWIFVRLKKKTILAANLLALAGTIVMWLFPSLLGAWAGMLLPNIAANLINCFIFSYIPMFVPEDRAAGAIGMIQTFSIAAVVVVSYFVTYTMKFMGFETYTQFLVMVVAVYVICTLLFLLGMNSRRAKEVHM